MFKKISAVLIILAMTLQTCAFAVEADSKILYNESFNQMITNDIPATLSLPDTGYARVVANEAKTNKSLMIKSECDGFTLNFVFDNTKSETTYAFTDRTEEYKSRNPQLIASVDLSREAAFQNMNIGFYDITLKTTVSFVKIADGGAIKTYNDKVIGYVSDTKSTNVAIGYDLLKDIYFIAINGRKVISDWQLPQSLINPGRFVFTISGGTESGAGFIDNVNVYTGTKIRKDLPVEHFNDVEITANEVATEVGSARFMDNDFEDEDEPVNGFYPIMDKSNKLSVKYDSINNNHYFYMDKTLTGDPFCDVQIQTGSKFVVGEMDLMITKPGAKICPYYIRDNTTTKGTNIDVTPVLINPDLSVTVAGKTVSKVRRDTWFHIATVFNATRKTLDFYLNGELLAENVTFTSTGLKTINLVRLTLLSGTNMGDLCVDNFKVYEGIEPQTFTASDEYISIFADGSAEKALLADKVAVHGYSGSGFINNEKYQLDTMPQIVDDKVYVEIEDAKKLLGGDISGTEYQRVIDSKTYLNIGEYAKNALGKQVYDDGNGLVAIGDTLVNVSADKVQLLNDYMFYKRPSAEEISRDFDKVNPNSTEHPRILANKDDFLRIKNTWHTDTCMEKWCNTTISAADALVADPQPVTYYKPDGIRLLEVCRTVLSRMESLGFAYQLTGDMKYVDRAWLELTTVFAFKNWNPGHMLDTGEMTTAVGIAYDWMYDGFTDEQKREIEKQIKEKGLGLIRDAYYGRLLTSGAVGRSDKFATWMSNFNTVINGSGVVGALAIAETDRDFCFDIVEKAIRSLEYVMPLFNPDGGWEEGVTYWGYNMSYLTRFMGSLDSALGEDFGITNYKGLKKTAMFPISLETWNGQNNFHDAGSGHIDSGNLTWLAKKYDDPSILRYRRFAYEHFNSGFRIFDPIYYDTEKAKGEVDAPLDWYTRGIESCASRASYENKEGLVYSAHAGPTTCYHSQWDTGTFIFELLGVRWAIDLGADSYTTNTPAEQLYKKRPEGHNTLVINPGTETGQLSNTYSPIVSFESKDKGSISVMDMSEPYAKNATKVLRGFLVGDERRSLTIRDEIDLIKDNSTVYWFMQTKADVETTEKGAILRKDGRELKLEFETNVETYEITSAPAGALPSSPHPEEDLTKFPNTNRIAIKLVGSGSLNLTVKLSALDDVDTGINDSPISQWTIPEGELIRSENIKADMIYRNGAPMTGFDADTTTYDIMLNEDEEIPEFTISAGDKPCEIIKKDRSVVLNVYSDANKTSKRTYLINMGIVKSIPELSAYKRLVTNSLTVGSTPEPVNKGSNMLDGDLDTRWTTFTTKDEALFDLGEVKRIDKMAISFWKGDERTYTYEILASEDGFTYNSVFSGNSGGVTAGMEFIEAGAINARYIKIIGNGSNANVNTNICEFAMLQTP